MAINLKKAKFYLEKDNEHIRYEAKVTFKEHRYRLELNKTTNYLILKYDDIPEKVTETIKNYLINPFERHKIEKIQHFIPINTRDALDERKNPNKYELIVATKNKEKINWRNWKYFSIPPAKN